MGAIVQQLQGCEELVAGADASPDVAVKSSAAAADATPALNLANAPTAHSPHPRTKKMKNETTEQLWSSRT